MGIWFGAVFFFQFELQHVLAWAKISSLCYCWGTSLNLTFGTLLCKCVQHRPCWCLWHCFWFEQIQQCCFWNAFIYLVCQNWKGKTTDLYWWYVLYLRYDNPSCSQVFRTRCLTTIYSGHCQCKRPSIIWNTLNQLSKQRKDRYAKVAEDLKHLCFFL